MNNKKKCCILSTHMIYTPTQKEFISEFDKLLQHQQPCLTVNISRPFLDGVTIIREPFQRIRREGRTTALSECVRQLFYLRCNEPLKFAMQYTNIDRPGIIERYKYASCGMDLPDLYIHIQEKLLHLYVVEVIQKYHLYYRTLRPDVANEAWSIFIKGVPSHLFVEAGLFFRYMNNTYEEIVAGANNMLCSHDVIIFSDRMDFELPDPSDTQKYRLSCK